ncbi:XVIPCD domain-containing protein [Luteibacter sp.]|jgi:putative chitinase|uniref:XVIPCD domain-containing protein n=1 Tax=Luteibacter sp. TaxID=1886636 RepID=UPI002F40B980
MAIDRESQLLAAAAAAGITRPKELANFMAQVSHESNGLNRLEESFRYTRNIAQIPVQSAWREGEKSLEIARLGALQGRPEKLAELMYGGRNGNDLPGEGYLYRGRGYMQLTGKDNYRAAGEALNLDMVKHPELAAEPNNAARIAVWYWQNRVPEAAREDVKAATHAINGRYNGLENRRERFAAWEKRLTPEVTKKISEHRTDTGHDTLSAIEHAGDLAEAGRRHHPHHHHHAHGPGYPPAPAPALTHTSHRDYPLFLQAQDAVHRLDAEHRREPDQRSENLAAALTVAARRQGMQRIDHVALSADTTRAYAVQGDSQSPHKQVAEVATQQATVTSVEQSTQALAQHAAKAAHEQHQDQQASQQQASPALPPL